MRISILCFLFWLLMPLPKSFADTPEILVNELLVRRLNVRAGDTLQLSTSGDMRNSRSFRVAAVYQEKADPYAVPLKRNLIKMHLTDLEQMLGRADQLDLISIQLTDPSKARNIVARLNGEAIGFAAYSADELAVRSSSTFQVVSRFHKAISLITMMAGAIFIFALMVMRVEDQRRNLAVMSVLGISRKTILRALVLESTCFAFAASILGAFIGIAASAAVNLRYQHFYETNLTFASVTYGILFQAASISFGLGLIAGTFSWFRLRNMPALQELGR